MCNALKQALTTTPLLIPPNYNKEFFLYLSTSQTSIEIILVQIDDDQNEYVIYYLSKGLIGAKLCYTHVEKLDLTTVLFVQCFWHYILLYTSIIGSETNPMQYILSCHTLGGKYSKWIVILQEFDLEFITTKSKKSLVFVELMTNLPQVNHELITHDSLLDESLFPIDSSDSCYGYILIYLQTQNYQPQLLKDNVDAFTIKHATISSLETHSTIMELTSSCVDVLLTMRLKTL